MASHPPPHQPVIFGAHTGDSSSTYHRLYACTHDARDVLDVHMLDNMHVFICACMCLVFFL